MILTVSRKTNLANTLCRNTGDVMETPVIPVIKMTPDHLIRN